MIVVWLLMQDRDYEDARKVLRVYTSEGAAEHDLALLKEAETPGALEIRRYESKA